MNSLSFLNSTNNNSNNNNNNSNLSQKFLLDDTSQLENLIQLKLHQQQQQEQQFIIDHLNQINLKSHASNVNTINNVNTSFGPDALAAFFSRQQQQQHQQHPKNILNNDTNNNTFDSFNLNLQQQLENEHQKMMQDLLLKLQQKKHQDEQHQINLIQQQLIAAATASPISSNQHQHQERNNDLNNLYNVDLLSVSPSSSQANRNNVSNLSSIQQKILQQQQQQQQQQKGQIYQHQLQQLLLQQHSMGKINVDNDTNNVEESFYVDRQQQQQQQAAAALLLSKNAQYELIKTNLEKKKMLDLQMQQHKSKLLFSKFNQQQQQSQPNQYESPNLEPSKEYILSQLKAQKQKQKEQQQQQQLMHVKQNQRLQVESSSNEILTNANSSINLMHLVSKESSQNSTNNNSPNDSFGSVSNSGHVKRSANDPIEKLKLLIIENNNANNQQQQQQQLQQSLLNSETAKKIDNLQLKFQQKQQEALKAQQQQQIKFENEQRSLSSSNNEQQSYHNHQPLSPNSCGVNSSSNSSTCSENSESNSRCDKNKSRRNSDVTVDTCIEISNEGFIKNIPPNMLLDQYGMLGLSMMWQHRENTSELDKNISLIIGKGEQAKAVLKNSTDLIFSKSNKNNTNSSNDISMLTGSAEDRDETEQLLNDAITFHLKPVNQQNYPYEFNGFKRERLNDFNEMLKNCKDDLLFYLFYMCCKNDLQVRAYELLCSRNWLYNKELQVWIKPVNDENCHGQIQYFMFDVDHWEIRRMN